MERGAGIRRRLELSNEVGVGYACGNISTPFGLISLMLNRAHTHAHAHTHTHGASVAEWLERTVAVREVSGSPVEVDKKNHCGYREPSDYISFRRAFKEQCFNTLKTQGKIQEQHNSISLR